MTLTGIRTHFQRLKLDQIFFFEFSLLLLLLSSPYKDHYTSYTVIMLAIAWISYNLMSKEIEPLKQQPISFYLIPSLFILNVFSLFYSDNFKSSLTTIEHTLSFIVFPIVLLIRSPKLSDRFYYKLKQVYVTSILLAVLTCWLGVTVQMIDDGASFSQIFNYKYSYMNLEKYVTLSGIHFSLYIILAIIFCLDSISKSEKMTTSILKITLIAIFTIFTLHLGSRMGILIIIAVITTFFINRFFITKAIKNLFAPLIIILTIAFGIFYMPYLKVRVLEYALSIDSDDISIKDKRLIRWQAGWKVFENNILFGVGSGDAEEKLLESYKKNELTEAYNNKLNAHNQFLQMAISNGLVGVLLFIGILIYQFRLSIKHKSFVWFAFTLSVFLASLTESILERQKSILLFSLFTCLFIRYYERERRSGSFGLWVRRTQ